MNTTDRLKRMEARLDAVLDELLDAEDDIGCLRYLDPVGCPELARLRARQRVLSARTDRLVAALRPLQVAAAAQAELTAIASAVARDLAAADQHARAAAADFLAFCSCCGGPPSPADTGVCSSCADLYDM